MNLLSWVLGFLGPFRRRILLIVTLVATELLLAALAPWPLKVLVERIWRSTTTPDHQQLSPYRGPWKHYHIIGVGRHSWGNRPA